MDGQFIFIIFILRSEIFDSLLLERVKNLFGTQFNYLKSLLIVKEQETKRKIPSLSVLHTISFTLFVLRHGFLFQFI